MIIAYDAKRFFHNASGLGNYSRDLVRIMARYYPDNHYLLLNKNKSERGKAILERDNVTFVQTTKGKMSRQLKMGKDAQKCNADIFHGLSGELPLRWDHKPIKKVVTIHDLIFVRFPKYYTWFDRKIHFWKFKKAAQSADQVIAISEQTKLDIVNFLNIPENKVTVVYQGCHEGFKSKPTVDFLQSIAKKYALPKQFVLSVGTIEERKNLMNVVKALVGTNIPLVVVGKKNKAYFTQLDKLIRDNKLEVYFLENVSMEELAAIYRLATIFVYPSFFEGFGIPVIEALFSETVVVTSNTSCLPEAGGPDSVYVDPYNVQDIKSKIQFLWDNEPERSRREEKGLAFAQKFDDQIIAQNLMAVYNKL